VELLTKANHPLPLDLGKIQVTASIGIALHPEDVDSARELLANADAPMYNVKELGRNGYRFLDESMNLGAHDQLALVQDLRLAARRGELFLQYQPKMKAPDGPLRGVEALARWRHPERGVIMPERFIPLAEKNGLIIEIGRWVLEEACRQMTEWRMDGRNVPGVAVNLSAAQFRAPDLPATIRETLRRNDLPAGSLTLEVTESTAMQDPEASLVILRELAAIGVHISIDDFGTGYSSLMYLKKLPASEIKIDRGFVKDLTRGGDDAAIVSAIVALGRTLNLDIIAEGVETEDQQFLLTELGCTSLQGFHLGRPVDAADLAGA
jgi:EAL domain-containing protein (putative c-di-GMP-specific phosphodiesterase class I)